MKQETRQGQSTPAPANAPGAAGPVQKTSRDSLRGLSYADQVQRLSPEGTGDGAGTPEESADPNKVVGDKDTPGVSNCYDDCAVKWPPLFAADDAKDEGEFTVVTRKDGTKMWAHDGWPLYLWINDKAPGDTTGDKVGDVWHTATE